MDIAVRVDAPADVRHPQVNPMVLQQRVRVAELGAEECSLRLPDDDRVKCAVWAGKSGEQPARLWASLPGRLLEVPTSKNSCVTRP